MDNIRQTVIIPDENKIKEGIYLRQLTNSEAHGLGVYEFSNKYNLGLSCKSLGLADNDFHDIHWFIELTKMGHLVIQKDEDIVIYIPPIVTKNQYRYLIENRFAFQNYGGKIHVISLIYENGSFYEDSMGKVIEEYESTPFNLLYDRIRQKYIPSNDSYTLIIPNENDFKIENGLFLKEFDSNTLRGHGEIYKDFCRLYNLDISLDSTSGYLWGLELSNRGMLSVTRENDEIYLFIPEKISHNQLGWFVNRKDYLSDFNIIEADILINNQHEVVYLQPNMSKEEFLNELYGIILSRVDGKDGTLFQTGYDHFK